MDKYIHENAKKDILNVYTRIHHVYNIHMHVYIARYKGINIFTYKKRHKILKISTTRAKASNVHLGWGQERSIRQTSCVIS